MSQPDMNAIMAQAQKMQQELQEAQAEIMASTVEGTAGNGLVKVALRGSGEVESLTIDPSVVDPEDVETLQDLIIGAYQDAGDNLKKLSAERMGPLSQGLDGLGF
ncbi:MAG: YbaB/EbfC family nucleoid-associated protein [Corynebacterium sp.]|uniref:Nucleoid-associated protein H9751_00555 n=1 Tax=Candidatus Corynebacterium faecigallinarum TaxID=2838528 RepID=A0A9D2QEH2_9CORY|nr:YbaB/EbfC family nucleoid-associated protein [Corynebacterium sp.]HJC84047.1 YbaB/EbfC family nucleoid-associated protein [Candidatus Corynebacterium faecigallinarum]MDN5723752.1 YbaB/EbfC family nucleoid-associated protein [Corynebacterium sp.]MDN6283359.1 YbaB/EbfC family nucleoid-associated protein [Corynebacterium sp.]MDN6306433.1 YbaB/EbfC family nucleoid-associated protein [Corynebacterium sp.]MDN6354024.1 YbaB/EbfC family nucleoid-associated protein [Corynebacterium sp.]